MKAQLLVNLKISSGKVISANGIYDSTIAPLPDFIVNNLDNPKIVKVLVKDEVPVEAPVVQEIKPKKTLKIKE